jgi:hypothetical protein
MRHILVPLAAGIVVMGTLVLWRGFFWQHAAIIGLAVAALVYSARGTFQRLRDIYRRD